MINEKKYHGIYSTLGGMIYFFADNQILLVCHQTWLLVASPKWLVIYDSKIEYPGKCSASFMKEVYEKTKNPHGNPHQHSLLDYKWTSETLSIYAKTGYIQVPYT